MILIKTLFKVLVGALFEIKISFSKDQVDFYDQGKDAFLKIDFPKIKAYFLVLTHFFKINTTF